MLFLAVTGLCIAGVWASGATKFAVSEMELPSGLVRLSSRGISITEHVLVLDTPVNVIEGRGDMGKQVLRGRPIFQRSNFTHYGEVCVGNDYVVGREPDWAFQKIGRLESLRGVRTETTICTPENRSRLAFVDCPNCPLGGIVRVFFDNDYQQGAHRGHRSFGAGKRSVSALFTLGESQTHKFGLATVDPHLGSYSAGLKEGAYCYSERESDVPRIGPFLLCITLGFFGGFFTTLFGVRLHDKRKIVGTSLICFGVLSCAASIAVFLLGLSLGLCESQNHDKHRQPFEHGNTLTLATEDAHGKV
jgi:hypothetical protein